MNTIPSTRNKALTINLDLSIYGSFAEIGGGQETSSEFFRAGGASGTIAKSISAYDKVFSDIIYNNQKSGRYVSESRLQKMLDHEFNDLVQFLSNKKDSDTRFFAFANTVETINYSKTNQGKGWMGIRFQINPQSPPNEIILHCLLHEQDTNQQQNTLAVLGVNLIFAAYYYYDKPNVFLKSLLDNLTADRVEINMIRMNGPELSYVDNRLLSVQLVKNGMTSVTIFDRNGQVRQPGDFLYKKNVMILRGSFRPITYTGFDMLKSGFALLKKEVDCNKENNQVLCEITLNNLLEEGEFDEKDFLNRVDLLNGMGQSVIISPFKEFYKLVAYLSFIKINSLRLVVGAEVLSKIVDPIYYEHLKGGILEAFSRLFPDFVKMYVYPCLNPETNEIISLSNININPDVFHLYQYLIQHEKVIDILDYKKDSLSFSSHKVLKMIKEKNPEWKKMVPVYISEQIISKNLFGC